MKFKDLFTPDRAIFATIFQPNFAEQYTAIFGETVPQVYDVLTALHCGEKELLTTVTPDTYKDIVNAVITVNVTDWVKAAKAMQAEYEALNPTQRETTRSEKVTENEIGTDVNTDSRKAFNDTDFSPDIKGTADTTKNRDTDITTIETVSGIGSTSATEIIRKEFALRLDKWRESLIFALVNEITLSIYK